MTTFSCNDRDPAVRIRVGRCVYCGSTHYREKDDRRLGDEHVIPESLGGNLPSWHSLSPLDGILVPTLGSFYVAVRLLTAAAALPAASFNVLRPGARPGCCGYVTTSALMERSSEPAIRSAGF